ncbi:hypothetical protein ACVWW4_000021 [Bradyrhizobium sp. LB7.1]
MTGAFDVRSKTALGQGAQIKFTWEGANESHTYATVLKEANTAKAPVTEG